MEVEEALGPCKEQLAHGCYATARSQRDSIEPTRATTWRSLVEHANHLRHHYSRHLVSVSAKIQKKTGYRVLLNHCHTVSWVEALYITVCSGRPIQAATTFRAILAFPSSSP